MRENTRKSLRKDCNKSSPDKLIVDMSDDEFKQLMSKIVDATQLYIDNENKTIDIDENVLPFNSADQNQQNNGQNGQQNYGEQNYQ